MVSSTTTPLSRGQPGGRGERGGKEFRKKEKRTRIVTPSLTMRLVRAGGKRGKSQKSSASPRLYCVPLDATTGEEKVGEKRNVIARPSSAMPGFPGAASGRERGKEEGKNPRKEKKAPLTLLNSSSPANSREEERKKKKKEKASGEEGTSARLFYSPLLSWKERRGEGKEKKEGDLMGGEEHAVPRVALFRLFHRLRHEGREEEGGGPEEKRKACTPMRASLFLRRTRKRRKRCWGKEKKRDGPWRPNYMMLYRGSPVEKEKKGREEEKGERGTLLEADGGAFSPATAVQRKEGERLRAKKKKGGGPHSARLFLLICLLSALSPRKKEGREGGERKAEGREYAGGHGHLPFPSVSYPTSATKRKRQREKGRRRPSGERKKERKKKTARISPSVTRVLRLRSNSTEEGGKKGERKKLSGKKRGGGSASSFVFLST